MITVVTGPPCSGKTTYVRSNAKPGDVVIDFDTMAQAFGSPTTHDHSSPMRHVTIMARRAAVAAALTVHEQADVWIVDCQISDERLAAYGTAGAHIVTMHASPEELHRRAEAERPGLWHNLIDQWVPAGTESGSEDW